MSGLDIRLKRVYLTPSSDDGVRVLVDRLWPRGVLKSDAAIDRWLKELGPSTELRRWFGHDPNRWDEFCRRYKAELFKQHGSSGRASGDGAPWALDTGLCGARRTLQPGCRHSRLSHQLSQSLSMLRRLDRQ